MVERESLMARCRSCLAAMNQREGWGLTGQQIDSYTDQIVLQVPAASLAAQLEQVARYFHNDHRLFNALQDEGSPDHAAAWAWAQHEIARTAQIKGLGWSKDRSVELSDLVQTVQAEMARALRDYRFESSLRTWLQGVTVRRLRRFHRDSSAIKRAIQPEPLEAAGEQAIEWDELEQEILAGAVLAEIRRALSHTADPRYAQLVQLHLVDDHTTTEIGERVHLHPSRVRALLKIARTLLQQDDRLRAWYQGDSGDNARHVA
jgi:RNA polymerase sigma factor (sigma-70 family)